MIEKIAPSAVVLLSGGQDSTTCLYWARGRFDRLYALTFDYGQRHRIELDAARIIARMAGVVEHRILPMRELEELGGSALLSDTPIQETGGRGNLPNTFVPGRNLLFLTLAAAWAYQLECHDLVGGMCQTDYSGYPDCRRATLDALEEAIRLGMEWEIQIHTPLMFLTKAQSVKLAVEVGAMDALAYSHTCYEGRFPPCGVCPACRLRARGFEEAGIEDPLLIRARQTFR
ncbi:MAG: 7-cyano-7-deazaguanine synthase QueC [Fimbriimonadales bacterium]|nr:7-cyano-7-deazaguanine synthase QueC [Fimbriimonadales bacterium]